MSEPARPTVIGPIPGAQPPWGAPREDVASRGYVVEEYQLDGSLVAYQLAPGTKPTIDGRWEVEEYGAAPYRTRILVVRPVDADHFNGTVVVNWQNVSAGFEGRAPSRGEIYDGYAWVGVSAQEVGLYGMPSGRGQLAGGVRPLVDQDPERYEALRHPGEQGCFDIFRQAGRAIGPERSTSIDPMAGLDVKRLVAAGASQSAMRLVTYHNAIHPLGGTFDAFLLAVWEGRAPRPEEGPIAAGVRTTIRTDLTTPVVVVNSEFEATSLAALPIADTEHLRVWEVAGTPHAPAPRRERRGADSDRVANPLSFAPVHDAALRATQRWLADGTPPPSQPRIASDPGPPPRLRRDEFGNAIGGIRLPELAAPTHEYRGIAFGTGWPPLFGSSRPFSEDELRSLYPSRSVFVARWNAAVDTLLRTGALRPEDATAMRAQANDLEWPVN